MVSRARSGEQGRACGSLDAPRTALVASPRLLQVAIPLYDSRGELMHMHYMEEVQTLAANINKVPNKAVSCLHPHLRLDA